MKITKWELFNYFLLGFVIGELIVWGIWVIEIFLER